MSMTLEDAIARCEKLAIGNHGGLAYALKRGETKYAELCKKSMDEFGQLAEWLKELSERRKQPERKVGEWTEDNACEFCGFKPWYERDIHTLSYCPNCGADMRGEQYE